MNLVVTVAAVAALRAVVVLSSVAAPASAERISPRVVTEPVRHDSDDPAIWIDRRDPSRSLVLGTDKETDGALVVFDLQGKLLWERSVRGLLRPNNVDVAYDLALGEARVDVAVVTERLAHRLRVFRLPDLVAIDGGGLPVFEGEEGEKQRDPMGVALWRRPSDGTLFAFVSRAAGPAGSYVWQYKLEADGAGRVRAVKVRAFGDFSGKKEIEALAVDPAAGLLYCSDETFGVRVYAADPDAPEAGRERALFGTSGFARDHEGISVTPNGVLVSDQQADLFRLFTGDPRQGYRESAHFALSTRESDGHESTTEEFGGRFPGGLLVAMSTDRTFHYYAWADLLGRAARAGPAGAEQPAN